MFFRLKKSQHKLLNTFLCSDYPQLVTIKKYEEELNFLFTTWHRYTDDCGKVYVSYTRIFFTNIKYL